MPDVIAILAPLALLAAALLAVAGVVHLLRVLDLWKAPAPSAEAPPFRRKDYLLSKGERAFFEMLEATLRHPTDPAGSPQMRILIKVRLLDLLWLPKGTPNRQSWKNKVQSKHVDFVLCRPGDIRPMLVIELDDVSHDRPDRRDRDAQVDDFLDAAGLPILHIRAQSNYDRAAIAQQIRQAIAAAP